MLFRNLAPICLASASPRRKLFLQNLGLDFSIKVVPEAEPLPEAGEAPALFAARAARAKALAVAEALRLEAGEASGGQNNTADYVRPVIIAADTVVAVDGAILGKPRDPAHGLEMLHLLNGRTHVVVSACQVLISAKSSRAVGEPEAGLATCHAAGGWVERAVHEETMVSFWHLPDAALEAYAYSDEPADKAGGYAVTGAGAFMVESIAGSINNVVGLPLTAMTRLLLDEKVITTELR